MLTSTRGAPGTSRNVSWVKRLGLVAGLVIGLGCAVALAVIAIPLAQYPGPDAPAEAATLETAAVARTSDLPSTSALSTTWAPGRTVRTTLDGSVVTAVMTQPRTLLGCTAVAFEVDAVPVRALCGPRPFWRPITGTTTGPDVDELIAFLHQLRYLATTTPSSSELTSAIRAWQRHDGHEVTGVVKPASLLWVESPVVPEAVPLSVGDLAGTNVTVLTTSPAVTAARLSGPPPSGAGPHIVNIEGDAGTAPVGPRGVVTDLSGLAAGFAAAIRPDGTLPTQVPVVVRLATPVNVISVPGSSIVTGADGTTCVQAETAANRSPIAVTVVGMDADNVLVQGKLAVGDPILTSPPTDATC